MDVLVDLIFPDLLVEDILCLRRTNKALYLLTHEPIIWKRFLCRLSIPIPPIRPTFRYTLEATDFEIEQLVTRSISLEENWRSPQPKIVCTQAIFAYYTVLDLHILPGGKYLIASVKDSGNYRFFLVIFCLDHPNGPRPLARYPVKSKALHLQAKYMKYKGQHVVIISFVCRSFVEGGLPNLDPSEYGPGVILDPPQPMENELSCIRINLESLEAMADPLIAPGSDELREIALSQNGPFFEIASMIAPRELTIVSLFELDDAPYVTVVEQPNTIVIANLHLNKYCRLQCRHPLFETHRNGIRAVRHIPKQNQLLVIHTAALSLRVHNHFLGVYDIPSLDAEVTRAYSREAVDLLSGPAVDNFHISDYGIPTNNEKTYKLRRDAYPPSPISIYMETVEPAGIKHVAIWPSAKPSTPDANPSSFTVQPTSEKLTYYYSLAHVVAQTTHKCSPYRARVLAGAYRSIVYNVFTTDRTATPKLVSLRRYINLEYQTPGYPLPRVAKSPFGILRRQYPPLPQCAYATCDAGLGDDVRARYQQQGIAASTWDEGIGRLCMASGNSDCIDIVDFAHVIQPQQRFRRWEQCQEIVHGMQEWRRDQVPLPISMRNRPLR